MMRRNRKIFFECIGISAILFFFYMAVFAVKGIWPFGEESVAWADMTHSMPLFYYLYDVLNGTDSFWFSWRYGTGINTLGIVSQQGMLSPINLLVLLFPRENVCDAVGILLAVKSSLMAASMYFYLSRYTASRYWRCLGAVAYSVGMSVLLQHPICMTLDIGVLFPLLIYFFRCGIAGEKRYWYPIILALCFIINFYMSVMVAFYLIIAAGTELITTKGREDRRRKLYYIATASLGGLSASAFVWIPVLFELLNSSRFGNSSESMYWTAVTTYEFSSDIRFVITNLMLFVSLILCRMGSSIRTKYNRERILPIGIIFVLMMIAVLVPGVELLWHMGSHSGWSLRFAFIVQFAVIEFALSLQSEYEVKENSQTGLNKHFLFNFMGFFAIFITIVINSIQYINVSKFSSADNLMLCTGGLFACTYCSILLFFRRNASCLKIGIGILFIAELMLNSLLFLAPNWTDRADKMDMRYVEDALMISDEITTSSNEWIRTKDWRSNFASNYAAVMNVNSVANWIHIVNPDRLGALWGLGYSQAFTRYLDNGGTILTDVLLGFKNAFSAKEIHSAAWVQSENVVSTNWYELKYDVPQIWKVNKVKAEMNQDARDLIVRQNAIFRALTEENADFLDEITVETAALENGMILNFNSDCELYLWSEGSDQFSIMIDGEYVEIQQLQYSNNIYPVIYNNGILDLGYFKSDKQCTIKLIPHTDNFDLSKVRMAKLDIDIWEKGLAKAKSFEPEHELLFCSNGVDMTIRDQMFDNSTSMIILPVLYDSGWSCQINNSQEDIANLSGMLAIPQISANMNVRLRYYPEGIKEGIVFLMIVQCMILTLTLLCRKWKVHTEKYISHITVAIMTMFLAVVYCIPLLMYIGFMLKRILL